MRIIFLFIIWLSSLFLSFCSKTESLKKVLASNNISIKLYNEFTIYKNEFIKKHGFEIQEIIARSSKETIKLRIINNQIKKQAVNYIINQAKMISALYVSFDVPQEGKLIKIIRCDYFAPEMKTFQTEDVFGFKSFLFANDRYSFGACNRDLLKYKTAMIILFCSKEKKTYEFSFFSPIEDINPRFEEIANSFWVTSCKPKSPELVEKKL